jgi:D-alanyl-D-alanine carboxypeptidase/D-alanyl-D-alanine-endopeptidase (penicillin-binding protein 4)
MSAMTVTVITRGARVRATRPLLVAGLVAVAAASVLVAPLPAGASGAASPSTSTSSSATPVPAPPLAPEVVLPASDGAPTPSPTSGDEALVAALRSALAAKPLGKDTTAVVLDVASGDAVYVSGETRPQTPASTVKTMTAVTALRALGPDERLTTDVVRGAAAGEIVLVGAGDATLTRLPATAADLPPGQAARPASLTELAERTASALRAAGTTTVRLRIDDSLFSGPRTAEGWPSTYVSTGVVSPVSALSADGGQVSASSRTRDKDPAAAAGKWFAARLTAAGIAVKGDVTRTVVAAGATPVASVSSPTVADLVERMLTESDNDLAEALAHLSGVALSGQGTFAGAAAATTQVLTELGVPTAGLSLVDGSGLSRDNVATARTLAGVLAAAVEDVPPVGKPAGLLWAATTGLPIAGVTGTLEERFDTAGTKLGRGAVRAKTGTLTGVVTLAGMVRDREGRLRVFAFLADASPGPLLEAQAALDRAATVVAAA